MLPFPLLLAVADPPPPCGLSRPEACATTDQLPVAELRGAVTRFLGQRRADFLYRGATVAEQALLVLGGPPDAPQRIGAFYRFTACRFHSCDEKGALVVTPGGAIVALAILHSTCPVDGTPHCYANNVLSLYLRGDHPAVVADLRRWATDAVAAMYTGTDHAPRLVRVDIVRVDRPLSRGSGARRPSSRE